MSQALQLIMILSLLIVLHELGHFIPARLFKTRVEKFYLFFDPWFSLFKFKRGGTEYGIGWLPLGGYVKIAGMIDESMDKEQMKKPPEPWEFRSKPAWQRLIIMVGGVVVNLILGIVIYAMVLFTWGKEILPLENVKYGIAVDSLAMKMGLKDGDKILSVDGITPDGLHRVPVAIILDQAKSIEVERNGQKLSLPITEEHISMMIGNNKVSPFIEPRFPSEIDSLLPGYNAEKAGLKVGDRVIALNDTATPFQQDVSRFVRSHLGQKVNFTLIRGADTLQLPVQVSASADSLTGFRPNIEKYLTYQKTEYGFFESFGAGVTEGVDKIHLQIKQIGVLFTVDKAYQSLGGFYSFGKALDPGWDWKVFWSFAAFLSIVLAFMNILPIPALDGGHVMFLLYELITKRKPNEKVMEYSQYAGMILLLLLMLYANSDFLRH